MSCHLLSATTYPNTVVEHCPLWCPFREHRFLCCEILIPPLRWFLNFIFLGSCRWRLPPVYVQPLPSLHERLPPSMFPVCERETATRDSHGRLMIVDMSKCDWYMYQNHQSASIAWDITRTVHIGQDMPRNRP